MKKLNQMELGEIIDEISLCINGDALRTVWDEERKPQRHIFNPNGESALIQLRDTNFVEELMRDKRKLAKFLSAHERELDKVKFVLTILREYERELERSDLSPEKRKIYEENLARARTLLKGTDEIYVYYNTDVNTARIASLTIERTRDVAEGKTRTVNQENRERIKALGEDFLSIVEPITPSDIHNIIACSKTVGKELRFLIEYNSILKKYNGDIETIKAQLKNGNFDIRFEELLRSLEHHDFFDEMKKTIQTYIEEIDVDKLYLISAIRYMEALERGRIGKEDIPEVYRRLKVIEEHLKKKAKLSFSRPGKEKVVYGAREMGIDMKRFIVTGEEVTYLTLEECNELKVKLFAGEILLVDLRNEEFEALLFNTQETNELLKRFPNNYVFFLRKNQIIHSKQVILRNIITTGECSQDLLQLLCEKTDITVDEICDLFDKGIISVGLLKSIREQTGEIITTERLFGKYQEYKEKQYNTQDVEEVKTQLERYALAYRNTELAGKTAEEIDKKGEEFIAEVGEEIEPSDLITLYGLDIIPLKVAVDWGGENIIERLLQNETLKPADARYLRDNALLDEKVLERLFKNSVNMSYSYQVSLVCTVFDGQTKEEQEIRERLAQYYNIENGIINSSGRKNTSRKKNIKGKLDNEPRARVKMRDPGAKYNLLCSLDEDVRIEEGIIDGHIIFHYPNDGEGTVLIEKLHKITTNRETGLIEIEADNQSATYIMSEEEFIRMKHQLIKEGKVDRTQLTQKWWVTRDPEHWIPHTGIEGWEKALKERFKINEENSRYSPKKLKKMEELIAKSIESKRGEDR